MQNKFSKFIASIVLILFVLLPTPAQALSCGFAERASWIDIPGFMVHQPPHAQFNEPFHSEEYFLFTIGKNQPSNCIFPDLVHIHYIVVYASLIAVTGITTVLLLMFMYRRNKNAN